MLRYYPSHNNLKNRFKQICSQHFGIMESQILMAANSISAPNIAMCTNRMPDYHKILVHHNSEMNYHLSGYGLYMEEALIRILGEGIERYALLVAAKLFNDKIVIASYNEMKLKGIVMPWEYIKIYSDLDYIKLQKKINVSNITPDDQIGWLKCPSIFDPEKEIYIPSQLLFIGLPLNVDANEKMFIPAFSKGAAAHTDLKKALKSAVMESIEADALMIRWYTNDKPKKILIDDTTLVGVLSEYIGKLDMEVVAYEYTLPDMPAHSFGVALLNNQKVRPVAILGCQTNMDPSKGIYRATFEALAIHYLASNGPIILPEHYLDTVDKKDFTNLDTNVAFWTNAEDADFKRKFFHSMYEGEVPFSTLKDHSAKDDEELSYLLNKLKEVSEYGVYLDITPPDVEGKGWKVVRTFFPELVQMSLPGHPYSDHPRIKKHGGIHNELPHPVP
jgi:thiazole/oxazole-forming peptide maturase SagD family component